jgi:hypothetical protein
MLIFETKSIEMKKSLFIFLFLSCFSVVSKAISVDYQVGMSAPNSHYFEVEMTVEEVNCRIYYDKNASLGTRILS